MLGLHACPAPSLAVFALAAVQRLPDNGLRGTLPDAAWDELTDSLVGIDLNGKWHELLGGICSILMLSDETLQAICRKPPHRYHSIIIWEL